MLHKLSIKPTPIIFVDKVKPDENAEFENLEYYLGINKKKHHEIKYPLNNMSFNKQIGKTEYCVSTNFDTAGHQTILQQFKKLILSHN